MLNFRNKADYENQKQTLANEAQTLLNENKLEEVEAKMTEIEGLDAKWEEDAKEMANKAALENKLKGLNINNIQNQSIERKGVEGESMEPYAALTTEKVYENTFAKALMGVKLTDEESQLIEAKKDGLDFKNVTQTVKDHTVVVPETVLDSIWQEMGESHPIIADTPRTYVEGDLTMILDASTDGDGEWTDETDDAKESDTKQVELNLKGNELTKCITVSWKMKKMSIKAYMAYVISHIAEKMANPIAKAIVSGKGVAGSSDDWTSQPKGILTALASEVSTPQVVTYETHIEYPTLTSAMSKIKSGYKPGSVIYATSNTVWNELANIKDTTGRPLFIPDVTTGGVGKLFGFTIKEEDAVPDGELVIGNVKKGYAMNVNQNMTIYQEEHVKSRKTDYMGYSIVDGAPITTKAFVHVKKA